MKTSESLKSKYNPAPWTVEARVVEGDSRLVVTNTYYWFFVRSADFAEHYVQTHNVREGWTN